MKDCYIARKSTIAARLLGDGVVIMSADSTLFTLNDVGSALWEAADGVTPLSTIVSRVVCAEFDVDQAQAEADAEEFVDRLSQHGVLLVSDTPIGG